VTVGSGFAAAVSQHPVTAHAVGEVIGQVLESLPQAPDLCVLLVTKAHSGALEDAAGAVVSTLSPGVLLGAAAESVVGPRTEVEAKAAVVLWAACGVPAAPVRLPAPPPELSFQPRGLIVLTDPFSLGCSEILSWANRHYPRLPVVGGSLTAGLGAGGNRLSLGRQVFTNGAAGVLVGDPTFRAAVAQGCRAIGRRWTVTRAEEGLVYELAGRPALARLLDGAQDELGPPEVAAVNSGGLYLGLLQDERGADRGRGDFLMAAVLGADRGNGAVAVGAPVPLGATVQYHLRDPAGATADLLEVAGAHQPGAALAFSALQRGRRLFPQPHHDAVLMAEVWADAPVAGAFCAEVMAPLGASSSVHPLGLGLALFGGHQAG
jgi:small ligand-binding sensory domain FIST